MLPKRFMNRQLTRWSGPIAGLLAGAYVGLGNPLAPGGPPTWVTVVGGGVIGVVAGCLVMVLDPSQPTRKPESLEDGSSPSRKRDSTVVGPVLAVFGLLVCWLPFFGLAFNVIGVFVNRGTTDGASVLSKTSLVIAGMVSLMMAIGLWLDA